MIARHDAVRIERFHVDQPEADLRLGQPGADARQCRAEIALQMLLRERSRMAEHAKTLLPVGDERRAADGVAGPAGERRRDRVALHDVG